MTDDRKFDQEQYDLLMKCSRKKDMTEWNEYAKRIKPHEINLEGANLNNLFLEKTWLVRANLKDSFLEESSLKGAKLLGAQLQNADLTDAHLEGADLSGAYLERCLLANTYFQKAKLNSAHLEMANLNDAHFEEATFYNAYLIDAIFWATHLEKSKLTNAHLEGCTFADAYLQGTDFRLSSCNSATRIAKCEINKNSDFRGLALDTIQWSPGLKQLAEYNNRRHNWKDWYKKQRWWQRPYAAVVWFFWFCSDYGRSTSRLFWTFGGFSLLFAILYSKIPGLLHDAIRPDVAPGFIRSLYFSVVTMTTLGFGDIHANPESDAGHFLLMFQVILGYVILGALVTRLSILFNSDGPADKFADEKGLLESLKAWWKKRRGKAD